MPVGTATRCVLTATTSKYEASSLFRRAHATLVQADPRTYMRKRRIRVIAAPAPLTVQRNQGRTYTGERLASWLSLRGDSGRGKNTRITMQRHTSLAPRFSFQKAWCRSFPKLTLRPHQPRRPATCRPVRRGGPRRMRIPTINRLLHGQVSSESTRVWKW